MLVHTAQATALEEPAGARFDRRLAEHLRTHFPFQTTIWGDETTLEIARFGKHHGLHAERDICLYVSLLPTLGGRFDEDPLLPWATSVLHDKSIREPTVRIERLNSRARDYLDATAGKNNEHLRQCADVVRTSWQHLLIRASQADPQTGVVFLLERTFPRKWAKAPLQLLPQFVNAGKQRAAQYEIRSSPGVILYLSFAFLFGWKFDEDPLLPMFTSILRQGAGPVPKERQLYEKLLSLAELIAQGKSD
jgi:hypothetical protein